jgi:plasmid stabilization system protein ParE
MKRCQWSHSATRDLQAIRTYLADFAEELADHQVDQLVLAGRWLADHPNAGAALGFGAWRKWRPRGTRQVLIYVPDEDGVTILRVRHERNDWRPVPEDA